MKSQFLKTIKISRFIPRTGKPSSLPGTVKYVGKKREAPVKLNILNFNETEFMEKGLQTIAESQPFEPGPTVTWLNINGVHDEKIVHEIGEVLNVHPLVLEDIANTTQRPKVEDYENYLFIISKMAYLNIESGETVIEQVSLLVGKDYVISLQEKEGDILEGLRDRIRGSKGKIRKLGSDYLLYGILDSIVDNYFAVLEHTGEKIENIEGQLLHSANQELLTRIYGLKQELVFLRRSIWPMRDVVSSILRNDYGLISDETKVYLRDVYDHTVQVAETIEIFREMASGMLDLYLSIASNRMNEVMKVLTIFAAIFIPLTFLAGVYGMNFEFMPELKWNFAYPVWWAVTLILAVGMLIYFKRKKWL